MVEPVAVAVQITKVGQVGANSTVVVFGCGTIGLLCQAVSKAYSAKRVIGIDLSQSRTAFAKTFGADDVFLPPPKPENIANDHDWSEMVARMIKDKFKLGEGPDIVLEATGAQSCIQTGVHLTRKGGMYVQAGMGREVCSAESSVYRDADPAGECHVPHHRGVYSRFDHPGLDSVYHRLLPHGRSSDFQWEDRRQATDH